MAQKRMFDIKIVGSPEFLDMAPSTRDLYFQLGMRADDDGFIHPRLVMKITGSPDDDLKVLIMKRFVIPFENGVVVIKHWKMNNTIRKDWYIKSRYEEEKSQLYLKPNKAYTLDKSQGRLVAPQWKHSGSKMLPEVKVKVKVKDQVKVKDNKLNNITVQKPLHTLIVNRFFSLKGWNTKDLALKANVVYSRHVKPAKDLLALCEGKLEDAYWCLQKVNDWAVSNDLDWSIETVFKRWYDLPSLKPKEKKPYYAGQRLFKQGEKQYYLSPQGERFEYVGSMQNVEYR